MSDKALWSCKVGEIDRDQLPADADADRAMRTAVEAAYRRLTGERPNFTFSGWGDQLDEPERAVVEDREPDAQVTRAALLEQLEVVERYLGIGEEATHE